MEQNVEKYFKHFSATISKPLCDYVTDHVFLSSRYIFVESYGKNQWAYCTHCRHGFDTKKLSHNSNYICPNCGSSCTVKNVNMHRKNLRDEAYFVFFEKSAINPDAIVARGINAIRNYSGNYHEVETVYIIKALYIFQLGDPIMLKNVSWDCNNSKFGLRSKVFSLFNIESFSSNKVFKCCSVESIDEAVKNTPYKYSTYEMYTKGIDERDMVEFFALYSMYPNVEHITKVAGTGLIEEKLENGHTYSAINWKGKNIFKVLKLTRGQVKEIKYKNIKISFSFLKMLQIANKDGSKLSVDEIDYIEHNYGIYFNYLFEILKYTTLEKAHKYIQKQLQRDRKHFKYTNAVLITWKDYIADCIKLQMDLSSDSVLFPKSLYNAHQNTIRQIKIKADESLNKKIRNRLDQLCKRFCFELNGLFIRPAESSLELIDEGKALNHCVGGYAQSYADGKTVILFIRKLSNPYKPYFTAEIRDNIVLQCRGLKNCPPKEDVEAFLEVFKADKLSSNNKTRITIPA